MAYNTVIQQGSFTSTGANQVIQVRSGVDWIEVWNVTQINANAANTGYQFYWQLGLPQGAALQTESNGAANAVNINYVAAGGFTLQDSSLNTPGPKIATTGTTNVVRPVTSTASTAGMSNGSTIARLSNIAALPNICGIDFTVGTIVANTSFAWLNALANTPGAVGGAGFYQIIPFDPLYYPTRRYVINITQASPAIVTTSVNHGYVVGQAVRLQVPTVFGMTQANNLLVDIVSTPTTGTFGIALDSTAFSAFTYPGPAAVPFTPAAVIPVGEETDAFSNPNLLDDATVNTGYIGVLLGSGANGPAGQNGDFVLWKAGKSFNT